jgi:hypothetical protein
MAQIGEQIGSINEEGWLANFDKKGFDNLSSIDELLANCLDAEARRVEFKRGDSIYISDDGNGMDDEAVTNMFEIYKKMQRVEKIGMANAGAKYALKILSNDTTTKIITMKDEHYITVIIDWVKMIIEGKYTKNILKRDSTKDEIDLFQSLMERKSGTTIILPYFKHVWETIENQINHENDVDSIERCLPVRYGKYPGDVSITCFAKEIYTMKKYNPSVNSLYTQTRVISVFKDKNLRFISDNNEEFKKAGNGVSKSVLILSKDEVENIPDLIGEIIVPLYIPFDPTYEKDWINAKTWVPPILNEIFPKNCYKEKQNLSHNPGIYRNGYRLGSLNIGSEMTVGKESIRANYESRLYFDIHADLHFNANGGDMEEIIGAQENKGQFLDKLPKELKKLVNLFKENYRQELLPLLKPKPQPEPPAPRPEPPAKTATQPAPQPATQPATQTTKPEPKKPSKSVPKPPPEPSKTIVVPGHIKGQIPDDDFDLMLQYMREHKDALKTNTECIHFFNTINTLYSNR